VGKISEGEGNSNQTSVTKENLEREVPRKGKYKGHVQYPDAGGREEKVPLRIFYTHRQDGVKIRGKTLSVLKILYPAGNRKQRNGKVEQSRRGG